MATSSTSSPVLSLATKIKIVANTQSESKSGITGEKSLKSLRNYEVGVVYRDKYGRETPVFTSTNSSFTIPKKLSDHKNSIVANLQNITPSWVHSYKYFIKETSNEYYNVCMDKWYDAEDGNIWLSFPSAERNKIQEDTFLILKKKAGNQDAIYEDVKYKVIDISNEAPDYIKTDYELYGTEADVAVSTATPGSDKITIAWSSTAGDTDWTETVFYDSLLDNDGGATSSTTGFIGWPLENVVLDISTTSGRTGWLDVANMYKDTNLIINLSKPLIGASSTTNTDASGTITSILPTGAGTPTIKLARKVVKNKSEFNGRFFVKIKRDISIDDNIRSVANPSPSINIQQTIQQYYLNTTQSNSDDAFWSSVGERWLIDGASRGQVGTGGGTGLSGPYPEDDGYGIIGDDITSGRGANSAKKSLECTMELTLQKIKDTNKNGYDVSNNKQANQDFLTKISNSNTKFRWKEDPLQHIYRISSVTSSASGNTNGVGILNYGSKNSQRKEKNNKCIRLYIKFKTTGWRLNDTQDNSGTYEFFPEEEGLYPFNYQNQYTPTVGSYTSWDPTKYGYGDYDNISSAYTPSYTANHASTALHSLGQNATFTESVASGLMRSNTLEIVDFSTGDEEPVFTENPAVWETEPKEDKGIDIYYEASQAYPTFLDNKTNELFAPYGSIVTCSDVVGDQGLYLPENTVLYDWGPTGHGGNTLLLNIKTDEIGIIDNTSAVSSTNPVLGDSASTPGGSAPTASVFHNLNLDFIGTELKFTRHDGSYTTARINYFSGWSTSNNFQDGTAPFYVGSSSDFVLLKLDRNITNTKVKLPYFNCYTFGNGVESDRIRDDFNAVRLDKGVRVSTVLETPYKEEYRTNGLIYSGIYNSNSGVNNLNQFIAAEKITKDVNPVYGSIQKLKTRDTNLVAFCEDKVLKIIANKDALYNADGNPQLTASNAVLGNVTTFAGEFGISTNPESYAEESFRMYFTDKQRGKVLRLSGDGITPISEVGMSDYFKNNLKNNSVLLGSFDDRKSEYNLTLVNSNKTISFSENAKGWVSFKSFIPENGVSINSNYYTFKNGRIWLHHNNSVHNNFYGDQYDSYLDIVFNAESDIVKSFGSMKYEGSQAKITQFLTQSVVDSAGNTLVVDDGEYYNLQEKKGWYVESGETDLQESSEMEFKEKEGKWFSVMKGKSTRTINDLNSSEFNFQGIEVLSSIRSSGQTDTASTTTTTTTTTSTATTTTASNPPPPSPSPVPGCTDVNATNYNPNADIDDGSCVYTPVTFNITVQDLGDTD